MTSDSTRPAPSVNRYLDADGRVAQWPSKLKNQIVVLEFLASHFEAGREYSEREVNELLKSLHTFEDWALLRRALFDHRFLDRESDGTRYRLRPRDPDAV